MKSDSPHTVPMRRAVAWSIIWMLIGIGFSAVMLVTLGKDAASTYLAGFLIERSLSIDNLFVFALIFGYFGVPNEYRHRLLFWGILGALVLRVAMIFLGVALIEEFHWILYVFGVFLVMTGAKMFSHKDIEVDPNRNIVWRGLKRFVPTTDQYDRDRFMTRVDRRWLATPLLPVFVVIATTDVMFAVDSIPAIFAITIDPYIVIAANVFALLGLRSLYFVLEGAMERFDYLQMGVAAVLIFVGAKMLLADVLPISTMFSLLVIVTVLATSMVASWWLSPAQPQSRLPER